MDDFISSLILNKEKMFGNKISPTIFGAIFELIMNPDTKRAGGIHFTSVNNIHKLIDPLFLDALNLEFETCNDLEKFHDKIANLKFLDPACGSGNFLIETYISLRKLEDRIIKKIGGKVKISIENFYGIEIESTAVQIAKIFFKNIFEGNALELNWKSIVLDADFIIGNPPYIGRRYRSKKQSEEISRFFDYEDVDYVACWIKKASDYIRDSRTEVAFVTTNSITQGEQVYPIWQNLFDDGIKINFAWSSFKWDLEAQVHCVIIGFANFDRPRKFIDGREVQNINGYLMDAPSVSIQIQSKPILDVPKIRLGNMPLDGGNLIIEEKDLESFVAKDSRAKKFIRRLIGAEEFINNKNRYCLWLVDATPNELRSIKPIYERVEACRKYRESGSADRRKLAKTPWLFREQLNPEHFLAIPKVSTNRREYLSIGFFDSSTIATDLVLIIPNGSLELFGILSSKVHMTWIKVVAGRLGDAYRYSAQIVYNNFPFPKSNPKIEKTAQKILDARSRYPNSSLADLYDPNLMPPDLRKAHDENDLAVLDAYEFPRNILESEIVSRLFAMYKSLKK